MANRNDDYPCEECGSATKLCITGGQQFERVMGAADYPGYVSPLSGKYIDSKKKRNEEMKAFDVRPHSSADQVKHHTGF